MPVITDDPFAPPTPPEEPERVYIPRLGMTFGEWRRMVEADTRVVVSTPHMVDWGEQVNTSGISWNDFIRDSGVRLRWALNQQRREEIDSGQNTQPPDPILPDPPPRTEPPSEQVHATQNAAFLQEIEIIPRPLLCPRVWSVMMQRSIRMSDAVEVKGLGWVTRSYAENRYHFDAASGEWLPADPAAIAWECGCCGEMQTSGGGQVDTERDGIVCEDCANNRYSYSSIQELTIRSSERVYLEDANEYVSRRYADRHCHRDPASMGWYADADNIPESEDEDEEDEELLHPYGADIFEVLDATEPHHSKFIMGVELEMEPVEDSDNEDEQRKIVGLLGGKTGDTHICKSDGSLGEGGVELVTLPGSLDWHRKEFGWEEKLKTVRGVACSGAGTSSCGMHVHVNRAALSPFQIGKLLVFINSPRNLPLVETIAQRSANQYCTISEKKVSDSREVGSRYEAINLCNATTIEFRIFRGNLRAERVFKNLEFVHAICAYVKQQSVRELENPAGFIAFVRSSRKQYPHLHDFLVERHLIEIRTPVADLEEA